MHRCGGERILEVFITKQPKEANNPCLKPRLRMFYICADNVYASNYERTKTGIGRGSAGAMIIKPNQVGTITGTKQTAFLAQTHGMKIVLSHRSGETQDDSIAHLAVAWNALMIKTGVKGGERLAKLNELIRIEQNFEKARLIQW